MKQGKGAMVKKNSELPT